MISPENYIRHRSRLLSISECLINSEWQEAKIANIIVSRRHSNGNVSVCLYLADLFCQGVKDTYWYFNISSSDYDDLKKKISEQQDTIKIPYELAHNIIYASFEYGGEWGFHSHKDFNNITKYFLEEDSDETELIDIECGVDGKPAFMRSPEQSQAEAERIIMKLEKYAGPGNYIIIDEPDSDDSNNDENDDEDFEDEDETDDESSEFSGLDFEEKKKLYSDFLERTEELTEAEMDQFARLTAELFDEICDENEVELHYNKIRDELDITVCPSIEIPEELLGPRTKDRTDLSLIKKSFLEVNEALDRKSSKAKKKLEAFRLKFNDLPVSDYLDLKFLRNTSNNKFKEKLEKYAALHPDYPLIRIMEFQNRVLESENISDPGNPEPPGLDYFFKGRASLHPVELFDYLFLKVTALHYEKRPDIIMAYTIAISEYDKLPDNEHHIFMYGLMVLKINFLKRYLFTS